MQPLDWSLCTHAFLPVTRPSLDQTMVYVK